MKKTNNTLFWIFSIFFLIGGVVFFPSIASVFMFILAVLLAPISGLQGLIKGLFPKKWLKTLLTIVLVVLSFSLAPAEKITEYRDTEKNVESVQTLEGEQEEASDVQAIEPEVIEPEVTEPEVTVPIVEAPEITDDSTFEIHFIDVGQADSALVLCDGQSMLIDGGNAADSSIIYSYLKNNNVSHLNYIIATHAHEDHIGGLSGALNYATVDTVYCPVKEYDSDVFGNFVKYVQKQNAEIEIPEVGAVFLLGSSRVEILGCNSSADTNNSSIVLKITYGDTSFLFTADAEREAEQVILDSGCDLSATVLKVGHHGSANSTTYPFLRAVMPKYAVISVGKDNSYGHPTEEALSRLHDADVEVFRTDLQGTVICVSDGEKVTFTTSKNENADTLAPVATIEQLEDVVKKSVDRYNGSSDKKLAGKLTYLVVSTTEVQLIYNASQTINADEEHLIDEALVRIIDFVTSDISASSYAKAGEVNTKVTVNYDINNGDEIESDLPVTDSGSSGTDYVGNVNSKKFHYSWCGSVKQMKESNKYYYNGTRDGMISEGYTPCKNCNP